MAAKQTVEMGRCVGLLMGDARPSSGSEVLVRSSLEAASVMWWLLEPGLTARQRVCRMQLLRRNSAVELAKSIAEVGADPSTAATENAPNIETECAALGLAPFGSGGDELEGERRLRYTTQVKQLTDDFGFAGGYSIYSGTAHAELGGLWRLFQQMPSTGSDEPPIHMASADPRTAVAAVNGALVAMIAPLERIAHLFGWTVPGKGAELSDTIDWINAEMDRLNAIANPSV